jgi:hypothetical protein
VHFENWLPHRRGYVSVRAGDRRGNRSSQLCQNCVTYPRRPWGNTVIYWDTSTNIDVAEVVESEVRWWDSVCVSTRGQSMSILVPTSRCSSRSLVAGSDTSSNKQQGTAVRGEDRNSASVPRLSTSKPVVLSAALTTGVSRLRQQQQVAGVLGAQGDEGDSRRQRRYPAKSGCCASEHGVRVR